VGEQARTPGSRRPRPPTPTPRPPPQQQPSRRNLRAQPNNKPRGREGKGNAVSAPRSRRKDAVDGREGKGERAGAHRCRWPRRRSPPAWTSSPGTRTRAAGRREGASRRRRRRRARAAGASGRALGRPRGGVAWSGGEAGRTGRLACGEGVAALGPGGGDGWHGGLTGGLPAFSSALALCDCEFGSPPGLGSRTRRVESCPGVTGGRGAQSPKQPLLFRVPCRPSSTGGRRAAAGKLVNDLHLLHAVDLGQQDEASSLHQTASYLLTHISQFSRHDVVKTLEREHLTKLRVI
jgi:hypothetical protein